MIRDAEIVPDLRRRRSGGKSPLGMSGTSGRRYEAINVRAAKNRELYHDFSCVCSHSKGTGEVSMRYLTFAVELILCIAVLAVVAVSVEFTASVMAQYIGDLL